MRVIPLTPGQNQTLKAILSDQLCKITLYENSTGLYMDLTVNAVVIRTGLLCLDRVQMITDDYLGFIGRLMFADTEGFTDPVASGLGLRYQLQYLEPGIDF